MRVSAARDATRRDATPVYRAEKLCLFLQVFQSCRRAATDAKPNPNGNGADSGSLSGSDPGSGRLGQDGLLELCNRLNLSEHAPYILGQLLPFPYSRIDFATFKRRFIQILPEIVEFSSTEQSPRQATQNERRRSVGRLLSLNSRPPEQSQNRNRRELEDEDEDGRLKRLSDNDTSNDIRSEFSDDATKRISVAVSICSVRTSTRSSVRRRSRELWRNWVFATTAIWADTSCRFSARISPTWQSA